MVYSLFASLYKHHRSIDKDQKTYTLWPHTVKLFVNLTLALELINNHVFCGG